MSRRSVFGVTIITLAAVIVLYVMRETEPATGAVIAGRYRLEQILGVGSTGTVYRAWSIAASSPVALKLLQPAAELPMFRRRLLRGARLASRLQHPHIVETLGHGSWGLDGDRLYVVMELVLGLPLEYLFGVVRDPGTWVALCCQLLEALAHVHARGVLHRDIKPANVLVSRLPDGRLWTRLTDFGLASARMDAVAELEDADLTLPGTVIGTPAYMAPEQVLGHAGGPPLDLYAIGVMLYRALSGGLPFDSDGFTVLGLKTAREPPPLLPIEPVGAGLVDVVHRMIARHPEARFAMAPDALAALLPHAGPAQLDERTWGHIHDIKARPGPGTLPPTLDDDGLRPRGLLGREAIMAQVEALANTAASGVGRLLVLEGAPGVGKSAILQDAVTRLVETGRFQPLKAICAEPDSIHDALRQLSESALGTAGRAAPVVEHSVREHLRRHDDDDELEVADLLRFLRPLPEEQMASVTRQSENFALVGRLVRRLARVRPVLLCIDDAHRGGAAMGAFLEFLLFELDFEPIPLLVIVSAASRAPKSGGDALAQAALVRSDRYEGRSRHTIKVGPLPDDVVADLLVLRRGLTRHEALKLARLAGGNAGQALGLARPGADARPLTDLTSSLEARLSELRDVEAVRQVLGAASVLGQTVAADLLLAVLVPDLGHMAVDIALDRLIELGLLTSLERPEGEFVAFSTEPGREAALGLVARDGGRGLLRRAVDYLLSGPRDLLDAQSGVLGDYYYELGVPSDAAFWWLRGMQHELNRGDALSAVRLANKALAVLGLADRRGAETALVLGRLLLDLGDLAAAEQVLLPVTASTSADLALTAGDILSDVYENGGRGDDWTVLLDRLALRVEEATSVGRAAWFTARSMWHTYRGDLDACLRCAREALDFAGPGESEQRAAQRLAFAAAHRGLWPEAHAAATRAVTAAGGLKDRRARALRVRGVVWALQDRPAEALACHSEALETARRAGLIARIPVHLYDQGHSLHAVPSPERARVVLLAARRAAEQLGLWTVAWLASYRLLIGDIMERRFETAMADLDLLRRAAVGSGMALTVALERFVRAWLMAVLGHLDDVVALLVEDLPWDLLVVDPVGQRMIAEITTAVVAYEPPPELASAHERAVARIVPLYTTVMRRHYERGGPMAARRDAQTLV